MNWDSFQNQRNKLGNIYNVYRKSDGKCVLRGASYNSVLSIVGDDGRDSHLYEIYFY